MLIQIDLYVLVAFMPSEIEGKGQYEVRIPAITLVIHISSIH